MKKLEVGNKAREISDILCAYLCCRKLQHLHWAHSCELPTHCAGIV